MVHISFLKKDMNMKLIFMITILIIAFAGFSSIYEHKLRSASDEYENKTKHLEAITAKLISEESKSEKISQQKDIAKEDREAMEKSFTDLKNENQALKDDLDTIKSELEQVKSELADKISKFNLLQNRFSQVENSLIEANNEISRLSVRVKELCNKLEDAGGSDEEC